VIEQVSKEEKNKEREAKKERGREGIWQTRRE
jgi:hypothetical protein